MNGDPDPRLLKQSSRRWKPGESGNPSGRPRGSKHAAQKALDAIGQQGAEAVLRRVVEAAQRGDLRAAEILLGRIWPARKDRLVEFDLPEITTAAGVSESLAAIAAAVSAGELSPSEGAAIAALVEGQRRALETVDLEARLAAIEQKLAAGGQR